MGQNGQEPAAESVLRISQRWLNFVRRLLFLKPGRYMIVVTVHDDHCDWTVSDLGKVEGR